MRLLIVALCFVLAGCPAVAPKVKDAGFTEETLGKDGTRVTVTKSPEVAHNDQVVALLSRPLVEFTCPPGGCVMLSFKVSQPIQGQVRDILQAPKEPVPELHPAAQVIREFLQPLKDVTLAIGPAAIVANGMSRAFSTFGSTVSSMAGNIQAPAGTNVNISGSNGVGVLGGQGTFATSDRHYIVNTTTTTTTTTDNRTALDILCNFYMSSGAGTQSQAPAYCQQR